MEKSFFAIALTAFCAMGTLPSWAGPGAPSGNPEMQLMELPDGATFSTGYNINNVLSYSPRGRYGWTLDAKHTPLNGFDQQVVSVAPDGKTFALVGMRVLEVRDMASGARRFAASLGDADSTRALLGEHVFSPDSTRVIISGIVQIGQPRLRVFDLRSGQMLQEIVPPQVAETFSWTDNARVEVKWDADAGKHLVGEWYKPRIVARTFDVALAPEKFVPAKLSSAGAKPDTPPKTTPTKRKASNRRTSQTARKPHR